MTLGDPPHIRDAEAYGAHSPEEEANVPTCSECGQKAWEGVDQLFDGTSECKECQSARICPDCGEFAGTVSDKVPRPGHVDAWADRCGCGELLRYAKGACEIAAQAMVKAEEAVNATGDYSKDFGPNYLYATQRIDAALKERDTRGHR